MLRNASAASRRWQSVMRAAGAAFGFTSAAIFCTRPAVAGSYVWKGGGSDNDFTTAGNWVGNAAPASDLNSTDLVFGASSFTFPSVPAAFDADSLLFENTAPGYAFGGGSLTLGAGGVDQNSAATESFGNAVVLGAAQSWTLNSAGILNFGGGINTAGYSLTLTAPLSGVIAGPITGGGSLAVNGLGAVTLSGASSFTGAATVNNGSLVLTSTASLTPGAIDIAQGGTFNISGGTVTAASGSTMQIGYGSGAAPALVTMTGGTVDVPQVYLGGPAGTAAALFNQSGGTLTTTELSVNHLNLPSIYNLSGNGNVAASTLNIGDEVSGAFNQTGATSVRATTLNLGNGDIGVYTLAGGSLVTNSEAMGGDGPGYFIQSGGTHTVQGAMNVGITGPATYVLSGTGVLSTVTTNVGYDGGGEGDFVQTGGAHAASSGITLASGEESQGTYDLDGGTLTTPIVSSPPNAGYVGRSTFNFDGGTLQASANSITFLQALSTTNVREGGAIIDTNGYSIDIEQPLNHSAIGTIAVASLSSGGSGYTYPPTVTVSGGGGYGAIATATVSNGVVTAVTITGGANYTSAPTLIFSGGGGSGAAATALYAPDPIIDGGLTKIGAGSLSLYGVNTYTGPTNVDAGILDLAVPGALPGGVSLTIASGAEVMALAHGTEPMVVVRVGGLTLAGSTNAWIGKLDLADNAAIVRGGSLATLTNQTAEGFAAGKWNGSGGIVSSTAAADTTHLTAIGVIQNTVANGGSTPLYTVFEDQSVVASDVLLKTTYYGDTNLDGQVDASDYSRIDNGYLQKLTGWYNGDFNYDGVINGSDYTLIDNAFNNQGAQIDAALANPLAQASGLIAGVAMDASVPEPTMLGLLGVASLGLLRRRRSR